MAPSVIDFLIVGLGGFLHPFRDLLLGDQTIVVELLVGAREPEVLVQLLFDFVSLSIHLLEGDELIIGPSQHFIQLLVVGHLVLPILLARLFLQDLLDPLPPLVVGGPQVEYTSLDNDLVEPHLVGGFVKDLLLYHGIGDQTIHPDLAFLSYSVRSVLCLEVHLGVPIGVEYNDCVSGLQVESQPPCPGT